MSGSYNIYPGHSTQSSLHQSPVGTGTDSTPNYANVTPAGSQSGSKQMSPLPPQNSVRTPIDSSVNSAGYLVADGASHKEITSLLPPTGLNSHTSSQMQGQMQGQIPGQILQGQMHPSHPLHQHGYQISSSFLNSSNVWSMPPLSTLGTRPVPYQIPDTNRSSPHNTTTPTAPVARPNPPIPAPFYGGNNVLMPPLSMPLTYPVNPVRQGEQTVRPLDDQQSAFATNSATVAGTTAGGGMVHVPGGFQMPMQVSHSVPPMQRQDGITHPILGAPFSELELSKEARAAGYSSTFKPITPKKNSRPRINKLSNQVDKKVMNKVLKVDDNDYGDAEPSTDPYFVHFLNSLKLSKEETAPTSPAFYSVDSELEKKLFDLFIHQVSTCMDMFMMGNFFSDIVPEMALLDESGLILSSMYSLSALMLQRIDPDSIDSSIPINYYHQTIKSIRHHLSLPHNGDDIDGTISRCLLSTILLCVYEMFFLATDNTYVKGAVSLLTSIISKTESKSPLKDSPFLQMCFWAMFVCDLILSLKFNLPTMFSVKQFWMQVDKEFIEQYVNPITPKPSDPNDINGGLFIGKKEAIWWLHRALIQFSIINEFNCQVTVLTDEEFRNNKIFHDWLELNVRIDEFERCLPEALRPVLYKPSSSDPNESNYPTIYFRDELSALISLQFKLSKVSLYQALIQKTNLQSPEVQSYLSNVPRNHAKLLAKDIIGILISYDLNLYLWPINIHTIRQVARYLHDDKSEYKELEYFMGRVIDTCHFIFNTKGVIG